MEDKNIFIKFIEALWRFFGFHWLSHKLQNNQGRVVSWHDGNSVYIGFKCTVCNEIDKKTICVANDIIDRDINQYMKETKDE